MKTSTHKKLQSAFNSYYQTLYCNESNYTNLDALRLAQETLTQIKKLGYTYFIELVKTGNRKGYARRIKVNSTITKNYTNTFDFSFGFGILDNGNAEEILIGEELIEFRGHNYKKGMLIKNPKAKLHTGKGKIISYALGNDGVTPRFSVIMEDTGAETAWDETSVVFC